MMGLGPARRGSVSGSSPVPFIVRLAQAKDAPAIALLIGELGYKVSDQVILKKLNHFAEQKSGEAFVATEGEHVLGCISVHVQELFHAPGRLGRITSLVVNKRAEGAGVGRALMERANDYFRTSGCVRAEVTSGDHRPATHRFYVANGYAQDERRFVKHFCA